MTSVPNSALEVPTIDELWVSGNLAKVLRVDYRRCGAMPATFHGKGNVVTRAEKLHRAISVPVVKIHGSVNWLYCDNCRQLYWFPVTPHPARRAEIA